MRIKITVSYDGTNYSGWQVQPNAITVQQQLQRAIYSVTGEQVKVTGSGRTDAGVHAEGQVAHFDTECKTVLPQKFSRAINAHLPPDIRVISSCLADSEFNACTSAKRKTYAYSLYVSDVELPLFERTAVRLNSFPDLEQTKKASEIFIGKHDFKCFNASGGGAKTTVRTIFSIDLVKEQNKLTFYVCGDGFLYNMVRTLVGSLLEVGYKKTDLNRMKEMLQTGDRSLCGKTLPAKGLCLKSVEY